jgi:hypothetical protein
LLVFAWCALGAPVAQAARPGTLIANGQAPSVAVDGNGTGYVAYNDQPPGQNDEPVGLCVIPHGASRCSSNTDVLADGSSGEAQPALVSAAGNGLVAIVSGRCCFNSVEAITSADGGATWTAPNTIGDLIYFDGAIGPTGQVLLVQDNSLEGIFSQVSSLTGQPNGSATLFNPPPGGNAIAGWSGNTPVVVGSGTETAAAIYSGSGDPNDGANWDNVRVPGSTSNPSMASGPAGLFLLQDTGEFQGRLTVRKFEGTGFGPAHIVHLASGSEATALAEDPAGRLIAMWYESGTIFASASADQGVHWSRFRVIATDVDQPGRMNAALGPDGTGWLVYENLGGGEIRLVPLNVGALGIKAPAPPKHRRHHKPVKHHKPRKHHKPARHHKPVKHHKPRKHHKPAKHHKPVRHHKPAKHRKPAPKRKHLPSLAGVWSLSR